MKKRKLRRTVFAREDFEWQISEMKANFPQFRWNRSLQSGVVWRGWLQPTSDSPKYFIRIKHQPDSVPRVFVEKPELPASAKDLHRYPDDGRLCLYWPDEWQWSEKESLARTIVCWTALWLYYFEIWQVVGEWLGPSSPHGRGKLTPVIHKGIQDEK